MATSKQSDVESAVAATSSESATVEKSQSSRSTKNSALSPQLPAPTDDKLMLWQGVVLFTADRLGVGVLSLPNDVQVLGYGLGLGFLLANFPINYCAGELLGKMALNLEGTYAADNKSDDDPSLNGDLDLEEELENDDVEMMAMPSHPQDRPKTPEGAATMIHRRKPTAATATISKRSSDVTTTDTPDKLPASGPVEDAFHDEGSIAEIIMEDLDVIEHAVATIEHNMSGHKEGPTHDLIGISNVVFESPGITRLVIFIYYLNLFLVLGDFLLVMARAVSAIFLDQICIPTAGAIASVFMFGICQLRTMARLGRSASVISVLAMVAVVTLCLVHHRSAQKAELEAPVVEEEPKNWFINWFQRHRNQATDPPMVDEDPTIRDKLSSIASIGFVVGSQKLFLNIRHELRCKRDSSKVLARSLTTYCAAYLLVIALAGPDPPQFLFDAIPEGLNRRIAGFLLLSNVAVSYAINSQALCSSIDRLLVAAGGSGSTPSWFVRTKPQLRWLLLTMSVSVSSYLVSMAVPFLKDLVALIGALTSVPLSLGLPSLLHRRYNHFPVLWPTCKSLGSYSLFLYSIAFLALGLAGAIVSIDKDWLSKGSPFGCRSQG